MEYSNLIKSKITKIFLYTFIGRTTFAGINFVNMTLIARNLGPSRFGIFSLLYAILSIIVIISDFGMSVSIVKFYSEFQSKNEFDKIDDLLKISFKIRLIISLTICIIGLFLSYFLSVYILKSEELIYSMILVFIAGIGLSFFDFFITYFQSKQEFKKYIIYLNIYSSLIFIFILVLIYLSILTVFTAILVYCIIPYLIFGITMLINRNKFSFHKKTTLKYRKIMRFNIYIIISNICSMFFNRIDLFFLNSFLNPSAVGIYSAAFQMAQIIALLTNSITFILLPKISELINLQTIKKTFKMIIVFSSLLYTITIPIIIFSPFLIPLILTNIYSQSITIFQMLILSFGMSFIINPLSILLYKIDKPKIITISVIVQLTIILVGDPIFILFFQIYGVVYISLITHVFALLFITLYLYYNLFKTHKI